MGTYDELGNVTKATELTAHEVCAAAKTALGRMPSTLYGWGPNSEHNNAKCIDFMVYNDKALGDFIAKYIWDNRARLGLKHEIWRQRIISVGRASEGWRGMSDRGGSTQNHFDHVHANFANNGTYTAASGQMVTGNSDPGSSSDTAAAAPVIRKTTQIAWNPEMHPFTRPPRLDSMAADYSNATQKATHNAVRSNGLSLDGDGWAKYRYIQEQNVDRGYIHTKIEGTETLSTMPYGCQFHYAPTSLDIDYGSRDDISIQSLTQGGLLSPDKAASSISVTLYFNRIFDLSGSPKDYRAPLGQDPFGTDHWAMIQEWGTQWDVEYLLRACNGDPRKSTILEHRPTADFGALLPTPVRLGLGTQVWEGIITSLHVSHAMFTPKLVPMLSSVSISLSRVPTLTADPITPGSQIPYGPTAPGDFAGLNASQVQAKIAASQKAAGTTGLGSRIKPQMQP